MKTIKLEDIKTCCTCKWSYVKDFCTGICDNPKTDTTLIKPYDTCECWEDNNSKSLGKN